MVDLRVGCDRIQDVVVGDAIRLRRVELTLLLNFKFSVYNWN
jgi:hypothetical protein